MKHILAANGGADVTSVLDAARTYKPVRWIVPKGAHAGDKAIFHLPAHGLAAQGVIETEPAGGGQSLYTAMVREIVRLDPPVPLAFLRRHLPSWKWLTYPRSYTTIDGRIEARLETLLKSNLLERYVAKRIEGGSKSVALTRYESNRKARHECITHYGAACYACGFSFGETYGETAKEYIQVHHLTAVPRRDGQYVVDPVKI